MYISYRKLISYFEDQVFKMRKNKSDFISYVLTLVSYRC